MYDEKLPEKASVPYGIIRDSGQRSISSMGSMGVDVDHDQRFKVLLQEFFGEFLQLFFPQRAARFDLSQIDWPKTELFPDPPQGDVERLDLIARLPHRPLTSEGEAEVEETVALVHVEVESRESTVALRPRMWLYYTALRRENQCRVLPIALFLRVGLEGIGIETYEEHFDDFKVVQFNYYYVGLPALDAQQYLLGENWLGVSLCSLMRIPAERRAWFRAEALRRILLECQENKYRKFLLSDCVEAYLQLDEQQQSAFEQMLETENYKEIPPMMQTTYDKGRVEGQRGMVQTLLEHHFGPLSQTAQQRLENWPTGELDKLLIAIAKAPSLQALGLEDDQSSSQSE